VRPLKNIEACQTAITFDDSPPSRAAYRVTPKKYSLIDAVDFIG
jgi:hypothetical protein